jgi:hypothetical protein
MPEPSGPPARKDHRLKRGDTFVWLWRWSVRGPDETEATPRDLTGYASRFTVRHRTTGAVVFDLTDGAGIELNADGEDGRVRVTISAAVTALAATGTHDWDQQFTRPDGTVVTPVGGYFALDPDAARS